MPRLARFLVVGTVGFVVDAALLSVLAAAGVPTWAARAQSFLVATIATYALNRRWTFGLAGRGGVLRGWLHYVAATLFGSLANYAAFLAWTARHGSDTRSLVIGTAIGSLVGLTLNYVASDRLVFRRV